MSTENEEIKLRQVAPYGDKLLVAVDPGTPIHDLNAGGRLIGIVTPGHQVANGDTIYITEDDFTLVLRAMKNRVKAH